MNIAQVVRSLELGGLGRVTVDLAAAQKKSGNRVTVYSVYKHDPPLVNASKQAGLNVLQLNKLTGFSIRTLAKMVRQFRRDRVTVVHTHNELVHAYGTIAGRIAGVPFIINTILGTKGGKDPRLDRIYRALLPWTDAVVTVSSETADQFADDRLRHPEKFHVIRKGIPV